MTARPSPPVQVEARTPGQHGRMMGARAGRADDGADRGGRVPAKAFRGVVVVAAQRRRVQGLEGVQAGRAGRRSA